MSSSLRNWGAILRTQNLPADEAMDPVSRWLLITRASVLPMTLFSVLIGGLLAVRAPESSGLFFALALVGLVAAHAGNNMVNDYFDLQSGVDSVESARARYAPHPLLGGLISRKGLLLGIAGVHLLDLAILLVLAEARGWPVATLALLGLFVSVFYVAPPLVLKQRGLGEPSVFLVWGPLMTCGTYYVTTGTLEPWVVVASLPYGLLVTCVLLGKHVDKLDADAARGIRTLAVRLGRERALFLTQGLMVLFFVWVGGLVALGTFGPWTLLCWLALPRLVQALRVYARPKPALAPPGYPIWPLWYVAWAFRLTRSAGGLLVVGLLLDAIFPLGG